MKQEIDAENYKDENGNPAGGYADGVGFSILWQKGPLGRGEDRKEPNGAFVEGVIQAALQRLQFYETTQFACKENAEAVEHLQEAMRWLDARTRDREKRGVEGTHNV